MQFQISNTYIHETGYFGVLNYKKRAVLRYSDIPQYQQLCRESIALIQWIFVMNLIGRYPLKGWKYPSIIQFYIWYKIHDTEIPFFIKKCHPIGQGWAKLTLYIKLAPTLQLLLFEILTWFFLHLIDTDQT